MTEKKKRPILRYLLIAFLLLFVTPIFLVATTVAATGLVTVSVEERNGIDLSIPVPALLLDLGVGIAQWVIPEHELREVRREAEPYLPALEEIAHQLETCPQGVLVQVKGGDGEHVKVVKNWRSYTVTVNSDDTNVRVKMPARLFRRTLDLLD